MNDSDIERRLSVETSVDADAALARFRERVAQEGLVPVAAPRRAAPRRVVQGLAAAAVVVVVASGLALSGAAGTVLRIFEPKDVISVPISKNDLTSLGQGCGSMNLAQCLGAYGTFAWSVPPQPKEVRSLAEAASAAGFKVLSPAALPPSAKGEPRFGVINQSTATFTFNADATRQAAAAQNRTIPPLPANIDGAKLTVVGGPAVVQVWGAPANTGATEPSGPPTLIVGQARAPVITSDGVTANELRAYLLQQPGVSPQLAAAIRAIGDPSSTLPVPVPAEVAVSHPVTLQGGVPGLFIGDNTGIASAVIWQKDGMIYEVIGSLTEAEALSVANSMR